MNDLVFLPAHELARAIRERDVSAMKVLEAHLRQIARHNPVLNAIVTRNEDQALQRVAKVDAARAEVKRWCRLSASISLTVHRRVSGRGGAR